MSGYVHYHSESAQILARVTELYDTPADDYDTEGMWP